MDYDDLNYYKFSHEMDEVSNSLEDKNQFSTEEPSLQKLFGLLL